MRSALHNNRIDATFGTSNNETLTHTYTLHGGETESCPTRSLLILLLILFVHFESVCSRVFVFDSIRDMHSMRVFLCFLLALFHCCSSLSYRLHSLSSSQFIRQSGYALHSAMLCQMTVMRCLFPPPPVHRFFPVFFFRSQNVYILLFVNSSTVQH